MNKHKARKFLVYLLLAFVIFLYVFSILVFLFGDQEAAIYVFAYSTFFTIIVYFLSILQRRLQQAADEASNELDDETGEEHSHKDN